MKVSSDHSSCQQRDFDCQSLSLSKLDLLWRRSYYTFDGPSNHRLEKLEKKFKVKIQIIFSKHNFLK